MNLRPPADDGSFIGEIKDHDGVVWTWIGARWLRGIEVGVTQTNTFGSDWGFVGGYHIHLGDPDDADDLGDPDDADDHG